MQSLGGYTFYWNPDRMTIPEKQKVVSVVETYGGSAVFEWAAILQGTRVELEWEFMPDGMYKMLRILYLQTGVTMVWNPEIGGNTYNVKIIGLAGEYFTTVHHEGSYRRNIKMTLDIRSLDAIPQSTTSTTSTTTTTL
jgi:hypothetical protein